MENMKDLVKRNLEELKNSSDAIYFLNTIKALEKIDRKLGQMGQKEFPDLLGEKQNSIVV